jgi:DNA invertase Pin-like site-specific DNA recombinase
MSASCTRRAVAYIRVAEDEAPDGQRLAIEGWAERERVDVASWQVDVGIDGATPIAERPGLLAAYGALVERGARVLVAANAERFSRDELVSWLIERAALTQGATIETADGSRPPARAPDRSEDVGYTRGAVDLARAYGRVTMRARVRAALAAKRSRGERVGTVPYGYRLSGDGVHIEPDEREQAVVETVRRLAGEGLSQRAIAARLAACGVAGRTGAPLGQTQVAAILRRARGA